MKKIVVTTFALSAITLMIGCSNGDGDGSPAGGAGAASISIVTVTGGQHVLTGSHATACYDDGGSGRIDVLTVTGAEWTNESNIYSAIDCTGGIVRTGKIIANIAGTNNDTQTSGWKGQGDIAPQRADATGSLSENETVTPFNIEVTTVIDPTQLFGGNVSRGFKATAFYVFDDTAGGDTYVMYRDDDGAFASASDPYAFTTHGTGGTGSQLIFPVTAISGNEFELANTSWSSGCYTISNSIDAEVLLVVTGTAPVVLQTTQVGYTSNDGTCSSAPNNTITTYDTVLDGTIVAISGWEDLFGFAVSAPQKQDGTGPLSDTESYSEMTATVTSTNSNSLTVGQVWPFGYVVDDSAATTVIYRLSGFNADQTPLFLQ